MRSEDEQRGVREWRNEGCGGGKLKRVPLTLHVFAWPRKVNTFRED